MKHEREVWLDQHAYERYCERVEPIGWQELERLVADAAQAGCRQKDGYVLIGGIWWRGCVTPELIRLHTCYGRSHLDIPQAIRWARLHNDRIALGDGHAD